MKIKKLIKKYNLFSGTQVIIMPHNSVIVGVDYERTYGDSHICMYVIEEEKNNTIYEERTFILAKTGEYIFDSVEYIGNCKSKDPGATAYHVFEQIK